MRKRVYLLVFGFLLATGLASAREVIIRVAPPPPVRVGVVGVAPRRGYVWVEATRVVAQALSFRTSPMDSLCIQLNTEPQVPAVCPEPITRRDRTRCESVIAQPCVALRARTFPQRTA